MKQEVSQVVHLPLSHDWTHVRSIDLFQVNLGLTWAASLTALKEQSKHKAMSWAECPCRDTSQGLKSKEGKWKHCQCQSSPYAQPQSHTTKGTLFTRVDETGKGMWEAHLKTSLVRQRKFNSLCLTALSQSHFPVHILSILQLVLFLMTFSAVITVLH